MAIEILMPALSPTMEEGTLAKWLVKEGDKVKSGQVMAEIETDKATMEFECVDEGIIGKLLIAEGTAGVKVNTAIAILLEDGEDLDAAIAVGEVVPAAIPMPPVADKATPMPPAIPKIDGGRVFASPLARRIANERNLNLNVVKGSGPHGRIVRKDIEAYQVNAGETVAADKPPAKDTAVVQPTVRQPSLQGMSAETVIKIYADRVYTEMPLDGMRRTIAARLTEAKQTIPHFYLRRDIRIDALLAFREQLNTSLKSRNVKLSVNDFVIKACALALQAVPDANAVWAGDRILKFKPSDISVAVAIEGGLFTPVLRDAESKSMTALSLEMKDLAARAKARKLAPAEYQGGSFSISNLGMMGIDNFDAVINPPQGAILAVGAGIKKPVILADGSIGIATVMSVTLSVDHRVIDGALGAELLKVIVDNMENPIAMLAG